MSRLRVGQLLLALFLGLAVSLVLWRIGGHQARQKGWLQIRLGMTLSEVETIYGCTSEKSMLEAKRAPTLYSIKLPEGLLDKKTTTQLWITGDHAVFVLFDEDNRVCLVVPSEVTDFEVNYDKPSLTDFLRRLK